jgi:uncharacterized protein (TIGR03083 family)
MEDAALLHTAAADGRSLLAAARADWSPPVPHCPGWDAAELVRHMGSILMWMAAVVTSRERLSRRSLEPGPADPAELPRWYLAVLDRALDVLGSADPDSETWTFSSIGDRRVAWWHRRLAVEVGIHRWDAQRAAGAGGEPPPDPVDGNVAAAGVEEFVIEFLPGLLAHEATGELAGTLHLHATDGPTEWWIDLDAAGQAVPAHAKADTAIRGTRSDLLLWLANRSPLDSLEVFGSQKLLDSWKRLRR